MRLSLLQFLWLSAIALAIPVQHGEESRGMLAARDLLPRANGVKAKSTNDGTISVSQAYCSLDNVVWSRMRRQRMRFLTDASFN